MLNLRDIFLITLGMCAVCQGTKQLLDAGSKFHVESPMIHHLDFRTPRLHRARRGLANGGTTEKTDGIARVKLTKDFGPAIPKREKLETLIPSTPVPEIPPDDVVPPKTNPPAPKITCISKPPCRLTWPKIDYPPSLPNYDPFGQDRNARVRRQVPERSYNFDEKVSELSENKPLDEVDQPEESVQQIQDPQQFSLIKPLLLLQRDKRSPRIVDQSRSPVIIPYFCHKMPCSGPLSSFPLGKGESSGRYQLPERRRTIN